MSRRNKKKHLKSVIRSLEKQLNRAREKDLCVGQQLKLAEVATSKLDDRGDYSVVMDRLGMAINYSLYNHLG